LAPPKDRSHGLEQMFHAVETFINRRFTSVTRRLLPITHHSSSSAGSSAGSEQRLGLQLAGRQSVKRQVQEVQVLSCLYHIHRQKKSLQNMKIAWRMENGTF
jgi:hypothetical protein